MKHFENLRIKLPIDKLATKAKTECIAVLCYWFCNHSSTKNIYINVYVQVHFVAEKHQQNKKRISPPHIQVRKVDIAQRNTLFIRKSNFFFRKNIVLR